MAYQGHSYDESMEWWAAKDIASAVMTLVHTLQEAQYTRYAQDLHHLRLYTDRVTYPARRTGIAYDRARSTGLLNRRPRLSLNVVRANVDTATAQITRSRPRPQFLTDGQEWALQQKAKKRGKFIEALFHRQRAYALGQRAFKDCAIFGTGVIKVVRAFSQIKLERTPPNEILVDDAEGIYGAPRSLYQVRVMDKGRLSALFPTHKSSIKQAPAPDSRYFGRASASNLAMVVEAWHLPSGPDANDGRHAVCIDAPKGNSGALLLSKPYTHQEFPFVPFRWSEDPYGWWGTGIAYELDGIQREINQVIRMLQANVYMGGGVKVFAAKGHIINGQINNSWRGTQVETNGPPQVQIVAPEVVPAGTFQHLQYLVQQSFALTGMSMAFATAQAEDAGESGRARLVKRQTESQRFLHVERQYENAFMALAERCLEAAADLAADGQRIRELYPGGGVAHAIEYDDVVMPDDQTLIQVFPTSILPETPAGKLAMVEALEARGYIQRAQAIKLLDFPDLDAEMNLELAPIDLIDQRLSAIVSEGAYLPPHPRMDLALAQERAMLRYQREELNGAPENVLDALGNFIDQCIEQQVQAQAQAAAAAAPAPGAPMPDAMLGPEAGLAPPQFPDQAPMPPDAPVAAE